MPRPITISNTLPALKLDEEKLRGFIRALDAYWDAPAGELDITFVSADTLAAMHADFCHDPTRTDIITFPYYGEDGMWGELVISPQAAREYIRAKGGSFNAELVRYVVHGYLHLLGYNDLTPTDRAQMRRLERKSLGLVKALPRVFSWKA
jgi:probable rRNA maturation factor